MKKIDLGQTLSILANAAVLAGIIFLAIEIQQNSDTQRMSVTNQVLGSSLGLSEAFANNLDVVDLFLASRSGEPLSERQEMEWNLFNRAAMTNQWQVFVQYNAGYLEEEIYAAYERQLRRRFRNPQFLRFWEGNKHIYGVSFQNYVDQLGETEAR